ncbi:MAG: glycoside hydrolase family 3 C-terminal domain-containing protein [Hyphomonadaceae bacterium]
MTSQELERLDRSDLIREKVSLLSGRDFWRTKASARLSIPTLKLTDGPNGARGDLTSGATAACFPVGVALGASFDVGLLREVGTALGREATSKGCQVLLGPTINLQRTPIGGRNFECYSEDPWLTGCLAVGFVQGVQSQGVAACPKHFVANDTEYERHKVSSNLDMTTLRSLYLRPFEMAVKEGGAWMIMSSYNRINGIQSNSNALLLRDILKGEWGFDGVVVSDWGGSLSGEGDYLGGLDLEMPGPGRNFNDKLADAIVARELPEQPLDEAIERLSRLAQRTAPSQHGEVTEQSIDRPEDRALARRAAIAGTVMLKNDGLLPLDTERLKTIAVIGPNAAHGEIMGGGSSFVNAHYAAHPLAALQTRLDGKADVSHAPGCNIHRYMPDFSVGSVRTPDGASDGFLLEFFGLPNCQGAPVRQSVQKLARWMDLGFLANATEPGGAGSVRLSGTFTPAQTGFHTFGVHSAGLCDIWLDGVRIIDNRTGWSRGEGFFGFGSREQTAAHHLEAGQAVDLELRFDPKAGSLLKGFRFGVLPPQTDDMLGQAIHLAKACDAVVLVLGANPDWETEGHDRISMQLPGEQHALAAESLAANPNTVVVLNIGAPVLMPWLDQARAVIVPWFGGQEMGNAVADILFGDAEPGGRLPFSWPVRLTDSPGYRHYDTTSLEMEYGEGLLMGYAGHHAHGPAPLFGFGHGLGYANLVIDAVNEVTTDSRGHPVVPVEVRNQSDRPGNVCVQIYADRGDTRTESAPIRLCGFSRAQVDPRSVVTVNVPLDPRWDMSWSEPDTVWTFDADKPQLVAVLDGAMGVAGCKSPAT